MSVIFGPAICAGWCDEYGPEDGRELCCDCLRSVENCHKADHTDSIALCSRCEGIVRRTGKMPY